MTQQLAITAAAAPCRDCHATHGHAPTCPQTDPCKHCHRQPVVTTDDRIIMIHRPNCAGDEWVCPSTGCDKRVVVGRETCPGCDGYRPCTIIKGCVLTYRHAGFCARTVPPTA